MSRVRVRVSARMVPIWTPEQHGYVRPPWMPEPPPLAAWEFDAWLWRVSAWDAAGTREWTYRTRRGYDLSMIERR